MSRLRSLALVVAAVGCALVALVPATAAMDPLPAPLLGRVLMLALAGVFIGLAAVCVTEAGRRWPP